MPGFFVMERDAMAHHLVGDPKHFYPWCWLIARACWKPSKFNIGGKTIALERGQICVSVRQLGDAWGWSKSAVDRFLSRLETETMIERNSGHGRLVITICNYGKYQDLGDTQRDSSGTLTGTAAGQQRDIKEPSNQETIQPRETNVSPASEVCQPVVDAWNAMASENDLPRCTKLSDKRRKACLARIKGDGLESIMLAIRHVPKSDFLSGRTGSWAGASFDFLVRPDTITSILEGKYDDRIKQKPSGKPIDGASAALDRQLGLDVSSRSAGRRNLLSGPGDSEGPPAISTSLW